MKTGQIGHKVGTMTETPATEYLRKEVVTDYLREKDLTAEMAAYAVDGLKRYIQVRLHAELGINRKEAITVKAGLAAESLIEAGGYGLDDSDLFGSEMGDLVKRLLECAFMRQPDMMDMLEDNGVITL